MKNVAILVVQYDTISKNYETDLTYCNNHDKVNSELYISNSRNVITELVKFAVGSDQIKELEQLRLRYNSENHK